MRCRTPLRRGWCVPAVAPPGVRTGNLWFRCHVLWQLSHVTCCRTTHATTGPGQWTAAGGSAKHRPQTPVPSHPYPIQPIVFHPIFLLCGVGQKGLKRTEDASDCRLSKMVQCPCLPAHPLAVRNLRTACTVSYFSPSLMDRRNMQTISSPTPNCADPEVTPPPSVLTRAWFWFRGQECRTTGSPC